MREGSMASAVSLGQKLGRQFTEATYPVTRKLSREPLSTTGIRSVFPRR